MVASIPAGIKSAVVRPLKPAVIAAGPSDSWVRFISIFSFTVWAKRTQLDISVLVLLPNIMSYFPGVSAVGAAVLIRLTAESNCLTRLAYTDLASSYFGKF